MRRRCTAKNNAALGHLMSSITEIAKFAELRAKTDRQLVRLVHIQLDRGLHLAYDRAKRPEAEQVYSEARSLLSKVYNLTKWERLCLEAGLDKLRKTLDGRATGRDSQVRRASA